MAICKLQSTLTPGDLPGMGYPVPVVPRNDVRRGTSGVERQAANLPGQPFGRMAGFARNYSTGPDYR